MEWVFADRHLTDLYTKGGSIIHKTFGKVTVITVSKHYE